MSTGKKPSLNVQDVDNNSNIRIDSSRAEVKSGIITEGDSKSRQRGGKNRSSSGEYDNIKKKKVLQKIDILYLNPCIYS